MTHLTPLSPLVGFFGITCYNSAMPPKNKTKTKKPAVSFRNSKKMTIGERTSDRITLIVGSWKFILIQSFLLVVWIILNITAWIFRWDPYPFILLNLALSFQAAYTAPIILMSQNRMAEKDRQKEAMDLATDRKAEREIEAIQKQLDRIERKMDQKS